MTSETGVGIGLDKKIEIREAPLDSFPASLEIPESIKDKLSWCPSNKVLRWAGDLSPANEQLLKGLSRNRQYQAAIRLLSYSQYSVRYNRGAAFISAFRWILLLLVAEIVKRIAEGMYEPVSIHPVQSYFTLDELRTEYVIGFLQFITTILIVFRYFTCLVDWIWRNAGISESTDLSNDRWVCRLSAVPLRILFNVAGLSLLEFVLIYHASKAVHGGDVAHWLHFLILLVVVDSIAFFVPNTLLLAVTFIKVNAHSFFMHCAIGIMKFAQKFGRSVKPNGEPSHLAESAQAEIQIIRQAAREQLRETKEAYGIWNLIDFSTLTLSLMALYFLPKLQLLGIQRPELPVCLVLTIVTLSLSWLNLKQKYSTYLVHLTVLGLRPGSA
jgi:hypothetical protein